MKKSEAIWQRRETALTVTELRRARLVMTRLEQSDAESHLVSKYRRILKHARRSLRRIRMNAEVDFLVASTCGSRKQRKDTEETLQLILILESEFSDDAAAIH